MEVVYRCNYCGRVDDSTKTLSRGLNLSGRQPKIENNTNKNHTCNSCLRQRLEKEEREIQDQVHAAVLKSDKKNPGKQPEQKPPSHVKPAEVWYEDPELSASSGTTPSRWSSVEPVDPIDTTRSTRSNKPPAARTSRILTTPAYDSKKRTSGTSSKPSSKPSSQKIIDFRESSSNPSDDDVARTKKPRVEPFSNYSNPESSRSGSLLAPANTQGAVFGNFNNKNLYGSLTTQQGTRGPEQGYSREIAPPPTTYQDTPEETSKYPQENSGCIILDQETMNEFEGLINSKHRVGKLYLCSRPDCNIKYEFKAKIIVHEWANEKQKKVMCKECNKMYTATLQCFKKHLRLRHEYIAYESNKNVLRSCGPAEGVKTRIVISMDEIAEEAERIANEAGRNYDLKCDLRCDNEELYNKTRLERHLRDAHLQFYCPICEHPFTQAGTLSRHMSIHE